MHQKKPHSNSDQTRAGLFKKQRAAFQVAAQRALENAEPHRSAQAHSGHRFGTMYRHGLALADLKPGECGYICNLNANSRDRLRLLEMGLTPGTHVKVVRAAAFGGPLDILVRGYQLSLRRDEATAVWLDDPDKLG
jgi:ferrous iron transport protein A